MREFALTQADRRRLASLERTIEKGLPTCIEVARALAEIRDTRLYMESHATFEEYLKGRWNLERRHAYRLINAAKVAKRVSLVSRGTQTPPILTERAARELNRVSADRQAEVWTAAVAASNGNTPTAQVVRDVVAQTSEPSDEQIAEMVGCTVEMMDRAKTIIDADPEIADRVLRGELDMDRAEAEIAAHKPAATCPTCGGTEVDVDGDCVKCREPHVAPAATSSTKCGRTPVGVIQANEAINALMRIPRGDALRARAWQIVRDWLDRNE